MRVILDANVIIAAAASRGLCEAILELCLENHHIVLCEGLLQEIDEKLRTKIKAPAPVIADLLTILRRNAQILEPEDVRETECRDPDDLMILGMISPGDVEVVVTGDQDLLVLKEYKTAKILTPRNFWESNRKLK